MKEFVDPSALQARVRTRLQQAARLGAASTIATSATGAAGAPPGQRKTILGT